MSRKLNARAAAHPAFSTSARDIEITDIMAEAAARVLAGEICIDFNGLPPGYIDPKYSKWSGGAHRNAHQGDYIDFARRITSAALAARHSPDKNLLE